MLQRAPFTLGLTFFAVALLLRYWASVWGHLVPQLCWSGQFLDSIQPLHQQPLVIAPITQTWVEPVWSCFLWGWLFCGRLSVSTELRKRSLFWKPLTTATVPLSSGHFLSTSFVPSFSLYCCFQLAVICNWIKFILWKSICIKVCILFPL